MEKESYPVLPMPGLVIFPELMTQIQTQDHYLRHLLPEIGRFENQFIVTMMAGEGEYFFQTGCIVQLEELEETPNAALLFTIRGINKFYIEHCPITHPVIYAQGHKLHDYFSNAEEAKKNAINLSRLLQRYIFLTQKTPDPILQAISFMTNPAVLTNFCAHYCIENPAERQNFLQTLDINANIVSAAKKLRSLVDAKMRENGEHRVY